CGVLSRQIGRDRLEAAAGCVPKAPCGGRGYRTTRKILCRVWVLAHKKRGRLNDVNVSSNGDISCRSCSRRSVHSGRRDRDQRGENSHFADHPQNPKLRRWVRFTGGVRFVPQILQQLSGQQSSAEAKVAAAAPGVPNKEPPFLGAAIKNHLVTVRDVK